MSAFPNIVAIQKTLGADIRGLIKTDKSRRELWLATAIDYAKFTDAELMHLDVEAKRLSGRERRAGETAESYRVIGLCGVDLTALDDDDADAVRDQQKRLADVLRASAHYAKQYGGLTKITKDQLAAKFAGGFQTKTREALRALATSKDVGEDKGLSADEIDGDTEASEAEATAHIRARLHSEPVVGTILGLRLAQAGEVFAVLGYRDAEGDHVTNQVLCLQPSKLKALMASADVSGLDSRINGIAEALDLAKRFLPTRPSEFPVDAGAERTDATPLRNSTRTTLVHDGQYESSLSHTSGEPGVVLLSTLNDAGGGPRTEHVLLNGQARSRAEDFLIPAHTRVGLGWGGFGTVAGNINSALRFKREKGGDVNLPLIALCDWGTSKARDPWAYRVQGFMSGGERQISGSELGKMYATYLDSKESRAVPDTTVIVAGAELSLKVGRAEPAVFGAILGAGDHSTVKVKVPNAILRMVLEETARQGADKVTFDADKRGVLRIVWNGSGVCHQVYIRASEVAATGVFHRYYKGADTTNIAATKEAA